MTEPTFGISITPVDNEAKAAAPADMSVVAIVGTAPAASATTFPLNTPVLMSSDDPAMIAALGETGSIPDAVFTLDAQLGSIAAKCIIVRVDAGANDDAAIANIVGNAGAGTGLHALKSAAAELGLTPRLIIVPGYTGQTKNGVINIPVTAEGTGYTNAATVTLTGGTGTGGAATPVVEGGKIKSVNITNPGAYTVAPTAAVVASGGGTGATLGAVALGMIANPVVAALASILDELKAHAFAQGPNTTSAAAKSWRETINNRRIIPLDIGHKIYRGQTLVTVDASAAAAGQQVAADAEAAGVPAKTVANRPLQGIVGLSRNVRFSLLDGATDGQDLLANNIGITVRGEASDGAIADSGFVMIAMDNAGDDDTWRFYHQQRLRDFVHLGFVRVLRRYLGRYPLTSQTVQAVLNSMTSLMGELQAEGHIIGFKVAFAPNSNNPDDLRMGEFKIDFKAEEAPLLRKLSIRSSRYAEALDDLLASLSNAA